MSEEIHIEGSLPRGRAHLVAGAPLAPGVQSEPVILATVAPDGTITHVEDGLLDEVAALLWEQSDVQRLSAYSDLYYADLPPRERDTVRAIARQALSPVLRRLAQARHNTDRADEGGGA